MSGYPELRIDIEIYEYIAESVCTVRSGVEFMMGLFKGIDANADKIIDLFIQELVNNFDSKIEMAKMYSSFNIREEDVPNGVPDSHTWWL